MDKDLKTQRVDTSGGSDTPQMRKALCTRAEDGKSYRHLSCSELFALTRDAILKRENVILWHLRRGLDWLAAEIN